MDYKINKNGDAMVVVIGDSVSAKNCETIQDDVLNEIEAMQPTLVTIDLSSTTYVSSAGLRTFSTINKICKSSGITCEIVEVSASLCQLFKLTGYASTVTIKEKTTD